MAISMRFRKRVPGWLWVALGASLIVAVFIFARPAQAIGTADTWVQLGSIQAGGATAAEASPLYSFDNNVFFATDSAGVVRSIDGGSTFTEVNNGLTDHRGEPPGNFAEIQFRLRGIRQHAVRIVQVERCQWQLGRR